jgi:hypothetical protein
VVPFTHHEGARFGFTHGFTCSLLGLGAARRRHGGMAASQADRHTQEPIYSIY